MVTSRNFDTLCHVAGQILARIWLMPSTVLPVLLVGKPCQKLWHSGGRLDHEPFSTLISLCQKGLTAVSPIRQGPYFPPYPARLTWQARKPTHPSRPLPAVRSLPGLLLARPCSGKGLPVSLIVKAYLKHEKGYLRRLTTCLSDKEEMKVLVRQKEGLPAKACREGLSTRP
jgi:hypothetical protein